MRNLGLQRKAASILVLFLACQGLAKAGGFDSMPEFQSLSEEEESLFEGPSRLNPEYQSDLLTYSKDEIWNYQWLTRANAMDVTVGSVSASHFLIDNRLKVRAELAKDFEFRFTYVDDRDLESEAVHHILELIYWPKSWLGLGFYGEPDLYKRRDDTGLSLLLKPTSKHEIRIFNTFVDVTRLKRNDQGDTYVEPSLPYVRGVVGRMWADSPGDFIEYAIRYETKTRWLFPDQQYEYDYWKGMASVYFNKKLTDDFSIALRAQWDRKFESKMPTDLASQITAETWKRDRFFVRLRTVYENFGPRSNWRFTSGIEYADRRWVTDVGTGRYGDLLPFVEMKFPAFGSGEVQDHWGIGVVGSWHRFSGPPGLFIREEQDGVMNYRLNLSYDFRFRDQAMLRLIATADLDEYGTRRSWEGGSGQFVLMF